MNHQLAIFILATTLSFFSSQAQNADSLNTDTLEQVIKSVKNTASLISPAATTDILDSLKVINSTDSINTHSAITNQDTLTQDTTSKQTHILRDSISTKSKPLIDTTQIEQEALTDSNSIHKDIINDTTSIQYDSLQKNTIVTIDSLRESSSLSSDSVLLDTLEQHITEIDTNNTQPTIDSLPLQTPLDSISENTKENTSDTLIIIKDTTSLELSPDTISKNEFPLILDTLTTHTQNDTLVSIDSLSPINTNNIIEIDTLKPVEDSSTTPLPDTTTNNPIKIIDSTNIDSVRVKTTPYEKLTGDALVDSIMNASMIEIQNNPKPKTKKPSATSLESYSVDDLPTEISFVVHAFDSTTKTPIRATVLMTTLDNSGKRNNGTGLCNGAGYFSFFLTPHSHFEITVSFPDYIPIIEEVDFTKTPVFTPIIKKEYALKKFQVGDVIHLKNVNFKQGDFHLQREAFPVLDKLAKLMTENPKMVIKLKGHTDNSGSPSANIKLSESRITEVRYYLLRKGIKLNRLKGEGYGGGHPLVPNNSPENMQKNRRVEFEVLKI